MEHQSSLGIEAFKASDDKLVLVKPPIELDGVKEGDTLRRFVDLPKLLDLLASKTLVLPRLRDMMAGDPFECAARFGFNGWTDPKLKERAKELENWAPVSARNPFQPKIYVAGELRPDALYQSKFDSDLARMDQAELRDAVWFLEKERIKQRVVCSCWYGGESDSDAMWKIYAAQVGVSIVTTPARLRASVSLSAQETEAPNVKLTLASVQYDDCVECGERKPWLIKRKAFRHESEVRLFCEATHFFGRRLSLQVDLSKLIKEIVITPFAKEWQAKCIETAAKVLLTQAGAPEIPIKRSEHMKEPESAWPPDRYFAQVASGYFGKLSTTIFPSSKP